jgi:alpha-amylase
MSIRLSLVVAAAITTALTLSSCQAPGDTPSRNSAVGVQLFMWNWESVAHECEDFLGPTGIDWVLVMPPQAHIQGPAWW